MAKINPVKVKQDADKLEKAGKVEQAISLYRQIVEDNPRDWNTIKKIGDLYARLNKIREATQEYAKVADFYAKDGFLLKSIAVWKQIQKLDASALEPYLNLADLYAKQGLMVEAKGQYQIVVDEYIKRGKSRDAGDVLKKMADIDPGDLKIRSKLADLYTREGNTVKAVEEHIAIAEELTKKGHLAEALQVLEKGLKLDAKSNRLRGELARIHLIQKNYERAAHFLEEAVQHSPNDAGILGRLGEAYLGAKKIEEAEAIFKRLLELNPGDQDSRIQMGRVYLMQGQFDRACDEIIPIVDKLLEQRDGEKAASLLQQVVHKNPSHVKSLVKLASVYERIGREPALVSTYSQLTEAYISEEQMGQAASILEKLMALEPQNQQHKTKLQFVKSKPQGAKAAPPAPVPAPAQGSQEIELEEEFELPAPDAQSFIGLEAEPTPQAAPAPALRPPAAPGALAPGRPAIELSPPLSSEDKEFIEEHLAEGKVFRKYGLIDKAADQFESVVARFPDNAEARQELRDVHKEKGQNLKAAEQCLALSEICRLKGDAAGAESYEAEARSLAPGAAPSPAAVPAPAAKAAPKPAPARPAPPPPPPAPEEEEEEITLGEEEIPLEVEEGGLEPPAPPAELSSFDLGPEVAEGEELPAQFLEEEPPVPEALAPEPTPASPVEDLPPFASFEPAEEVPMSVEDLPLEELAPTPPAPLRAAPARPAPGPPPSRAAPRVATPPPSAAGLPADLKRVLDEVDSYISLGFVDDAKEALREVSARYPSHPAIQEKIGELGIDQELVEEAPAPEAPSPALEASPLEDAFGELGLPEPSLTEPEAAAPLDGGGIDLGAELGGLFGAQSAVEEPAPEALSTDLGDAGLADIFKEFKKGVDKQLGKEDYDTRYNLGIAYKEMGLLDEAIAEFQLAAKDENRVLECSSMLGICFMEKGMPKLAIKWFEKGLKAPGRNEEEYQGLRYDLAMAYEADGEIDRALGIFTELYGQDANFRDVATKVRDLRAASH